MWHAGVRRLFARDERTDEIFVLVKGLDPVGRADDCQLLWGVSTDELVEKALISGVRLGIGFDLNAGEIVRTDLRHCDFDEL